MGQLETSEPSAHARRDELTKLRDDVKHLRDRARDYRTALPPSAVHQTQGACIEAAEEHLRRARAKLNEAIGWACDDN